MGKKKFESMDEIWETYDKKRDLLRKEYHDTPEFKKQKATEKSRIKKARNTFRKDNAKLLEQKDTLLAELRDIRSELAEPKDNMENEIKTAKKDCRTALRKVYKPFEERMSKLFDEEQKARQEFREEQAKKQAKKK